MIRLQNVLKISFEDVLKMSSKRLEDVLNLKMSWRRFCKTSWRRIENVLARRLEDVLKTSSKRLEDPLKTYGQDEYIGLDHDVFWRRMAKANMFVLIKTSWRRLEDALWRRRWKTSSSRRIFAGDRLAKECWIYANSPLDETHLDLVRGLI